MACTQNGWKRHNAFPIALQESGYKGWQIVLDPHGDMERVERGACGLFLPKRRFSLAEIQYLFMYELACHIGRCVAEERSPLGLWGLQMKN